MQELSSLCATLRYVDIYACTKFNYNISYDIRDMHRTEHDMWQRSVKNEQRAITPKLVVQH